MILFLSDSFSNPQSIFGKKNTPGGFYGEISKEIRLEIPVENSEAITGGNPAGIYGKTPADTYGGSREMISE